MTGKIPQLEAELNDTKTVAGIWERKLGLLDSELSRLY